MENRIDITKVKIGMFCYEDNTFSFEILADKRRKGIVELIDDINIYIDLTASEISDINEKKLDWKGIFSYTRGLIFIPRAERIIWYGIDDLLKVYCHYEPVRKTFEMIGKPCRRDFNWTITFISGNRGMGVNFDNGKIERDTISNPHYYRPVLRLRYR